MILNMDIAFIFTLICTTGSVAVWLSKQIHSLELKIDSINDQSREYRILNDVALTKQKDRITALKLNSQDAFDSLIIRVNDIERFLNKTQDFQRRYINEIDIDTYLDSEDDRPREHDWTEVK